MNTRISSEILPSLLVVALLLAFGSNPILAQDLRFEFSPKTLELSVGDTSAVSVRLLKSSGKVQREPFLLFSRSRGAIEVLSRSSNDDGTAETMVVAHLPGSHMLSARTVGSRDSRITTHMQVQVAHPPLKEIVFTGTVERLYTNTTAPIATEVRDEADLVRDDVETTFISRHPEIASVDGYGNITAHQAGRATVVAQGGGITGSKEILVVENPVVAMSLQSNAAHARTGDVVRFTAEARSKDGTTVNDVPIIYTVVAKPDDHLGAPASGLVDADGRFVAEAPGLYTVVATAGTRSAQHTVRVEPRNVQRQLNVLGHAPVLDVFTSDLWVWEGKDGRDYAVTGTWSANGEAYFWDVTDPANMKRVDIIKVDARTVNDVKVSEDGRVCVLSREGASNRRNGIVILDCSDPRNVKILSEYDDELTGGVHNVFIYDNHVYAVNNGRRYDIINIEDPTHPQRVGRFELDTPGHSIHDVWIEDGIAYSSNWKDGLQLVDVGGSPAEPPGTDEADIPHVRAGLAGGSPSNPVPFASYTYPSGWNHAAFPFRSEETGRFYVVAGDEAFPYERMSPESPEKAAGWLHFVDFTDLANPQEVARYQVPEAGSHNYWIENDVLYAGFYNGGLRIVDVSGDLMGDLYRQGREIASFLPTHPDGKIKNAPMVWGVQPHKGVLFVADHYSGLWALKLNDY